MSWSRRLTAHRRLLTTIAAIALVLAAAGAVSAFREREPEADRRPLMQDESAEPEVAPTAEELQRVVERLADVGVATDVDTVAQLASEHGLGGAVRVLWWSTESETDIATIVDMRTGDADTAPMGWGQIAKHLDVHPGIGQVMGGGNGHGRAGAPGQNRSDDAPAP
jgi:hypothetical protein